VSRFQNLTFSLHQSKKITNQVASPDSFSSFFEWSEIIALNRRRLISTLFGIIGVCLGALDRD